ncbi:MAG: cupin domain-containing protein [Bacteroidia bacterium]|nr:cupin domain-containing protein [Bacteroidia bacterium]
MKQSKIFVTWMVIALVVTSCNPSTKKEGFPSVSSHNELIFPKGDKITNNHFKGNAWLIMLVEADSVNQNTVGNVTFEPGARTNWHSHPGGQIILVMAGEGYYQEKGSPKRVLHQGDAVKCPANIPHWHGAGPDQVFIQLAITSRDQGPTVWLDPVTDEEYLGHK